MEKVAFLVSMMVAAALSATDDLSIVMTTSTENWYPDGNDVRISCFWNLERSDDSTPITNQVLIWKSGNNRLLKETDGDTVNSFVYTNTPIAEARLSCETDFNSTTKSSYLTIANITINDPTQYTCEVSALRSSNASDISAKVYADPVVAIEETVIEVDIRTPILSEFDYDDENATTPAPTPAPANEIVLKCLSTGAYPAPQSFEFYYMDNEVEVLILKIFSDDPQVSTEEVDGYFNSQAELRVTAEKQYDGKLISCRVSMESGTEPTATAMQEIVVMHETSEVSIAIYPSTTVNKGDKVTLMCESDGNPKPNYRIEPAMHVAAANSDNEFVIESAAIDDDVLYNCVAVSTIDPDNEDKWIRSAQKKLTVHYLNDPKVSTSSVTILKGKSTSISCTAEGNPPPTVQWKKDDGTPVYQTNLEISNAQYEDAGVYTCHAISDGSLNPKTVSATVIVQGGCQGELLEPVVSSSQETSFRYNLKVSCKVTGEPNCEVTLGAQSNLKINGVRSHEGDIYSVEYKSVEQFAEPVGFFCLSSNSVGTTNVSLVVDEESGDICCKEVQQGGLSTGAVIGIILLVLVVLVGIPVACYFVKKRNSQPKKKASGDLEGAPAEKEGLNKDASSETSDSSSLPPPPAEDHDHRLNSAHEMTTFSTNK